MQNWLRCKLGVNVVLLRADDFFIALWVQSKANVSWMLHTSFCYECCGYIAYDFLLADQTQGRTRTIALNVTWKRMLELTAFAETQKRRTATSGNSQSQSSSLPQLKTAAMSRPPLTLTAVCHRPAGQQAVTPSASASASASEQQIASRSTVVTSLLRTADSQWQCGRAVQRHGQSSCTIMRETVRPTTASKLDVVQEKQLVKLSNAPSDEWETYGRYIGCTLEVWGSLLTTC